jgi:beta-galactosidase
MRTINTHHALAQAASILCLTTALSPLSATRAAKAPQAPIMRETLSLNQGWAFQYGEQAAAVTTAAYDDTAWAHIDVPHTWNRIGEYGTTRSAETNDKQGVGYYRRHFTAPASMNGQREYLQFDAVGNIADVWVNGTHIGTHKGAFSRFRFDITEALKLGGDNLIVVKADNSKPAVGSSTQDVIPLGGDFFIFGGLYRGVSLITAPDAGIDLRDHGGPGVYAHAEAVSAAHADVHITTKLRNTTTQAKALEGEVTLLNAQDVPEARAHFRAKLAAGGTAEPEVTLSLAKPHLWNGRADPYLYHVRVVVKQAHGGQDSVTQTLGIRSYSIDTAQGFSLNGAHIALHGASRHQDRLGKGWALSPADHEEDMAIMADMGANTVRMAHYQHAQEWADAADKTGMVAWAEIPFVNASSWGDDEGSPALHANAREQLTELIRQNYNHPSIMLWSVGNEIDIGAAFGRGKPARSHALLAELNALAHKEDPSRLTTFADCCEETNVLPGNPAIEMLAETTDVMGYNRYYGWYYDAPAKIGAMMDHFHAKHPKLPLSVSEYGAGGALTQHSDNVLAAPISAFGRPHPEEYQNYYHEENWKQLKARPYIFADWIWNMFDFSSDLRQEGDAIDLNDKGMVSYDRKTKKDAFYFYRANWSSAPTLHIVGRRYAERAYAVNDIKIYTNADTANLSLNGVSLGERSCPDRICVWKAVTLKPGANTLAATATIKGQAVQDTLTLHAPDAQNGILIDAGSLAAHTTADGRHFGSDNFVNGGEAKTLNVMGFGRDRNAPRKQVAGATAPELYEGWREGSFAYTLALPNGAYKVTLHSFEPDAAQAATRAFSVQANGKPVLSHFNPATAAGGVMKATTASFVVDVTAGALQLDFSNAAILAAMEIVPAK